MKGMRALVVKTEAIDGIDREKFHSSGVNKIRKGADHALAFELHFVAGARRKAQQRRTVMAIDNDTELQAEPRGVPAVVLAFHPFPLFDCGE